MSHRSRDARRHDFFMIDNEVVDNYGHVIGPIGIAVYCYLARRAGNGGPCFPAHDTIAKAIGVSKKSVVEYLSRLAGEDKEEVLASNDLTPLIKIQRRTRQDGGATSNDYYLLPVAKNTQTPDTSGATPSNPGTHEEDTVQEEPSPTETGKRSSAKPTRQPYPEDFEGFWKSYPKGHGVKKVAYAEWQKLDGPERLAAVDGLNVWRRSKRWADGYIRDAERYLKYRMWENPPADVAPSSAPGVPRYAEVADPYEAQIQAYLRKLEEGDS